MLAHFWYLPSIPYASRLILKAPSEDAAGEGGELGAEGGPGPEMAALLGAIGVAATTLRPAGIARFGDAIVKAVNRPLAEVDPSVLRVSKTGGNLGEADDGGADNLQAPLRYK